MEWEPALYYVFSDKLFRACGTVPSGKLLTFTGNCDVNELLHIAAYLNITARNHPLISNIKSYCDNNRGKRGGDDTFQTVSDNIIHIFNGETFSEWVNSHGMTCTSADKSDVIVPHKPLAQ